MPDKKQQIGKWLTLTSLVVAIVLKSALSYHFFQFETDKTFQAIAAKNLIEGHGNKIGQVDASNLSEVTYQPNIGWPPGYTLMVAAMMLIIDDLKSAALAVDLLGVIVFLIALWILLEKLRFPVFLICFLLLFSGALLSDNITLSTPTDLWCVAFLLIAIRMTIDILERKRGSNLLVISFALINFLPAMLRFMYIPVVFFIPVFIIWNGIQTKNSWLRKNGIVMLGVTTLFIAALMLYQVSATGRFTYTLADKNTDGPEWSNLLAVYPFIFSSFMNLNFIVTQTVLITGFSYQGVMDTLRVANLILLPILLFYSIFTLIKRRAVPKNNWDTFLYSSLGLALLTTLVVCYASVITSSRLPPPYYNVFTYVSESRYFLLLTSLLPVYSAYYLFVYARLQKLTRLLQPLLLMLFTIEILHSSYYILKEFKPGKHLQNNLYVKSELEAFIQNTISENKSKGLETVFSSDHGTICNYAVLYGAKALYKPEQLNSENIHSSRQTKIYLLITDLRIRDFKRFISKKGVSFLRKIDFVNVYVYAINE